MAKVYKTSEEAWNGTTQLVAEKREIFGLGQISEKASNGTAQLVHE